MIENRRWACREIAIFRHLNLKKDIYKALSFFGKFVEVAYTVNDIKW